MSNVSHQTALALKESGFPQPDFSFDQVWHNEVGRVRLVSVSGRRLSWGITDNQKFVSVYEDAAIVFAPTLEYIAPILPIPELFHFEIWNGQPSCRLRDDENPRRTFGETFADAAAKMYLELKQNESPGQTFVQPGDVAQE